MRKFRFEVHSDPLILGLINGITENYLNVDALKAEAEAYQERLKAQYQYDVEQLLKASSHIPKYFWEEEFKTIDISPEEESFTLTHVNGDVSIHPWEECPGLGNLVVSSEEGRKHLEAAQDMLNAWRDENQVAWDEIKSTLEMRGLGVHPSLSFVGGRYLIDTPTKPDLSELLSRMFGTVKETEENIEPSQEEEQPLTEKGTVL